MSKSKIARVLMIASCAALFLAPMTWAQTAPTQKTPKAFAEGSVALVRFSSLNKVVNGLNEFASAFRESGINVPSVGNALHALIGPQIHNPSLLGVDMDGPMYGVVFPLSAGPKPYALVIPLADKNIFIAGLCREIRPTKQSPAPGVRTYVKEKSTFDRRAWNAAPPNERQNLSKFTKITRENFYWGFTSDYAVMSSDPDLCAKTLAWVKSGGAKAAKDVMPSMVAVRLAVAPLMKMYGSQLEMMAQQAATATTMGQMSPVQAKLMQSEMRMAIDLLKQIEELSIGANVDQKGLEILSNCRAINGTDLAKALEAQKPGKMGALERIPAGGFLAGGVHLSNVESFMDLYLSAVKQMWAGNQAASDAFAKMEPALRAFMSQMGGDMAYSLMTPKGDAGLQVVSAMQFKESDPTAARKAMSDLLSHANEMYKAVGIPAQLSLKKKASTYKGVAIDEMVVDISGLWETVPPAKLAEAKRAVAIMFGNPDQLTGEIAFVKGYMVQSFGKGANDRIKRLIDLSLGTGDVKTLAEDENVSEVFSTMPKEGNVKVYVSLGQYIRWIAGLAAASKDASGEQIQKMMESLKFPTGGVGFWMALHGDQIDGKVRIPMAQILAVARGAMSIKSSMQGAPGQAPPR